MSVVFPACEETDYEGIDMKEVQRRSRELASTDEPGVIWHWGFNRLLRGEYIYSSQGTGYSRVLMPSPSCMHG